MLCTLAFRQCRSASDALATADLNMHGVTIQFYHV